MKPHIITQKTTFALVPMQVPRGNCCLHIDFSTSVAEFCGADWFSDLYICGCCGGYFCCLHISEKTMVIGYEQYALCLSCARLEHSERERLRALRKDLEHG